MDMLDSNHNISNCSESHLYHRQNEDNYRVAVCPLGEAVCDQCLPKNLAHTKCSVNVSGDPHP